MGVGVACGCGGWKKMIVFGTAMVGGSEEVCGFDIVLDNGKKRYQLFRQMIAYVDNALHTLQATADYWNYVVACCCKTLQYNRTHHSSPHLS